MNAVRPLTLIGLFSLLALGCSSGNSLAPAKVSGTVKYNGKSLTAGTVQFHTGEGAVLSTPILKDGTYSAVDLPTGDMLVTVETESINPDKKPDDKGGNKKDTDRRNQMMGTGGRAAPDGYPAATTTLYMKIPEKYSIKSKSGLSVTLNRGTQTYDINMTDN